MDRIRVRAARAVLAVLLPVALGLPAGAHAHSGGAIELLAQVAVHPRDPDVVVLRYEAGSAGLLYSSDAGQSFRMLCASAISDSANRGTTVGIAGDGRVMLGSFGGLLTDDGGGCDWTAEPSLADLWVIQTATHPDVPDVSFAITSTGAEGSLNTLAMRNAMGQWSDLGQRGPLLITSLVAASTPAGVRLYETAEGEPMDVTVDDVTGSVRQCTIRVSDDLGSSWTGHPCPASLGKVQLVAVDPADPDRIVLSEHNETGRDVVWVSDDQGATLRQWTWMSDFGAIAFDGDGRVWVGDWGDAGSTVDPRGLLMAPDLATEPQVVADYAVHCLAYRPDTDTLYACQRFWYGTVDTTTAEFTTMFTLDDTVGFAACDGVDTAAACEDELCGAFCGPGSFAGAEVCEAYDGPACGPCAISDSALRPAGCDGATDGAMDGAGGSEDDAGATASGSSSDAGCGCRMVGGVSDSGPALMLLVLGAVAAARRRRCRRTRG